MEPAQVIANVNRLRSVNEDMLPDRRRIRYVMNGGPEAIYATLAWDEAHAGHSSVEAGRQLASDLGVDLNTVNLIHSGITRFAQQAGVAPTLKMPYGPRDSVAARKRAETRERIVEGWDNMSNMDLHYPQLARWLAGYAYFVWTIHDKWIDGVAYPVPKLRDPYDCYLGHFGPDQQPDEMAIARKLPIATLKAKYPDFDWDRREKAAAAAWGGRLGTFEGTRGWEGRKQGLEVYEYFSTQGTFLVVPEMEMVLDFYPNPLSSGAAFVVGKAFAFDRPQGQFHHTFGTMSMLAKLNTLALISAEDGVFRPVNIIGELKGNTYERGRFGINEFEPGTRIEKEQVDNLPQIWAQIDRLERHVRIGGGYDVQQDGQSPNSFATGQGMRELQSAAANHVRESQLVIRNAVEQLDSKRLEWDDMMHPFDQKRVYVMAGGREVEEMYTPAKDIAGSYRSRRVYGMMATWDEGSKLVGGLQLLQAGIIDALTMQETLYGFDDVTKLNDRIAGSRAYKGAMAALEQLAAMQDQVAMMTLVEISEKPQDRVEILRKFFTPQEPQMSPEEEAMMAAQQGGGDMNIGPDPTVQTIMAQMQQDGSARGGAQTVSIGR